MARTNNLSNFLTDVASAIKEKKGDSTNILASNFDTEILSLPSQGIYQSKQMMINTNGNYEITPDDGYDAIESLRLSVNVPSGSGDIKLFETQTEMQADPTAQEGDLAVVYRNETTIPSPGDTINSFSPPATVVFDTPITSSTALMLRGGMLNLRCTLDATSCTLYDMYHMSVPDPITYTSSDGITYTRTDSGAESYDLGAEVTISSTADTNILKFLSTVGMVFEGLYQYNTDQYAIAKSQLDATADYVYENTFYGGNGVESGTLSNMTHLTKSQLTYRIEIYNNILNNIQTDETDLSECFYLKSNLTTIPLFDTNNVTNMRYMFNGCTSLITIPQLNTSNVTDMNSMFNDCTSLTKIPLLDTSNVTTMYQIFRGCTNLTEIPLLDTSNVTDISYMFTGCSNLTTIPQLDTSSAINMSFMFNGCSNLITVPLLNTSNVTDTNMYSMFNRCTSLSNTSLNNILAMCTNATKVTSSSKTLKYIGLSETQANTCKTLSNYSAFTAAGWTTGY